MPTTVKHNHSIDIIKGWGIIAVILGHIFLGSAEESMPRYLIYAFHMPLFFFISGFLLNIEKIGGMPPRQFIKKYAKRMLIWWFIAWCFYTVCVNLMISGHVIGEEESTAHFIVRNLVYPWGHLWFVPGLFATIAIVYCLKRFFSLNNSATIAALLFISLTQMAMSYSGVLPNTSIIRYHNLLFFTLGIIANVLFTSVLPPRMAKTIILLYFILLIATRYLGISDNASMCNFASLIVFMIFGISPLMQIDSLKSSAMMEWLGHNSLQIYLWHEFPVITLKTYFSDNPLIYYSANFAFLSIILLFAWRISLSASKIQPILKPSVCEITNTDLQSNCSSD